MGGNRPDGDGTMTIETDDSRIQDLLHTKRQLEKALMAALEGVNSLKRAISMLNEAIEQACRSRRCPRTSERPIGKGAVRGRH